MPTIFVFGSNLAGRHGKGAALAARIEYGAHYGVGVGPTGHAYAIPTKDRDLRPIPLDRITQYVKRFIDYAERHPELTFKVTRIGCGLAGYSDDDIGPMFIGAPANCDLPLGWRTYGECPTSRFQQRHAWALCQHPDGTEHAACVFCHLDLAKEA